MLSIETFHGRMYKYSLLCLKNLLIDFKLNWDFDA